MLRRTKEGANSRRELPFAHFCFAKVGERLPPKGPLLLRKSDTEAKVRQFVEQERSFWLCYPKFGTIRKPYGPYFRSRAVGRSVAALSVAEQVGSQSL